MKIKAILAASVVGVSLFAVTGPANADQIVPRVVTHHEFKKAHKGMTFKEVKNLYGARAHFLESWYGSGPGNHFHAAYKYRAADGTWTDATFVDWTDKGGKMKLVRKNWY